MPCKRPRPWPPTKCSRSRTTRSISARSEKTPRGKANRLQLYGLTIYQNPAEPDGFPTLITAKSADYDRDVWTLHDAHVMTFDTDGFINTKRGTCPARQSR